MTKSKMTEFFKRFDDEKYNTFSHGVDFELIVHDREHGSYLHTGIGSGEDMSLMALYSLTSLYISSGAKDKVSIEQFAESVKSLLINAYNTDIFGISQIEGGSQNGQD